MFVFGVVLNKRFFKKRFFFKKEVLEFYALYKKVLHNWQENINLSQLLLFSVICLFYFDGFWKFNVSLILHVTYTAKNYWFIRLKKGNNINHRVSQLFSRRVLGIFMFTSSEFLAWRIMIALLFQTESDRLQFFCVWHRTTAGGRVARSFIKLLDVEGPAGRIKSLSVIVGRSAQLSEKPIERAGVGYRCSLVVPRGQTTDTQDIWW